MTVAATQFFSRLLRWYHENQYEFHPIKTITQIQFKILQNKTKALDEFYLMPEKLNLDHLLKTKLLTLKIKGEWRSYMGHMKYPHDHFDKTGVLEV